MKAIKMMDNGKIDESILLLQEDQKLDSENFNYPYEIGYANYLKKIIKRQSKFQKNWKDTKILMNDFIHFGGILMICQKTKKAIEIADKGISKFPNKGLLYLETGVVYEFEKEYNKAVETYQKGISVEPKYSSNYYRLSNLYLNSADITQNWFMKKYLSIMKERQKGLKK